MRFQSTYTFLLIAFIFFYQMESTYVENIEIEFEDKTILTDLENNTITVDGKSYYINNYEIQTNRISIVWSVLFYSVISFFIALSNWSFYSLSVNILDKYIFVTGFIYFIFFGVTDLICLIPNLNLYQKTVLDVHNVLSGTLLAFILIVLIYFKTMKK